MSKTMKQETDAQQTDLKIILSDYDSTWPADGPIDLDIHDLPHDASGIEWWYQNCHLTSKDGKRLSLFASFFRAAKRDEHTGNLNHTHSVIWSLSDIDGKKYYTDSLVDRSLPSEALKMIKKYDEKNVGTKWIRRALKEVYEKGNVPLPDRFLKKTVTVGTKNLSLEYDENSFKKEEQGNYHLNLENPSKGIACRLDFVPLTNPVRHGNNGVGSSIGREDLFYYFIPKCDVSGEILIDNTVYNVEGSGWYDHEFGRSVDENPNFDLEHDLAWNWIALQLDNGCQISGYNLFDNKINGAHAGGIVIMIAPDGEINRTEDFSFTPEDYWTSVQTFISYPVSWRLEIPEFNISLSVKAEFPEQEFITILSAPAIWEGCVNATGSFMAAEVSGPGYIEINGFNTTINIENFLKNVGKATQKAIESLLPLDPTDDEFYRLVNSSLGTSFFSTADKEQYVSTVIKPIREVVDRNKKSWRSYVFLACIDVVGGNSQPFVDWLAMLEIIHTGSLIVDDVQDKSDTRRGGTALHLMYGEALAINAGNACYFIGELMMHSPKLPEHIRLQVYEFYFGMMRAGHAGQAMDISGLHYLMPDAVNSGDNTLLEKRIYTIHRLKTAASSCTLAKMGALLGGGKPEEINALGVFFEAIGVAYQIMDDVLNLQGYDNNRDKGEDITAGKITMPVAKAMGLLPLDKREYVWEIIQTMPTDRAIIESVIVTLQNCGAIAACRQEAEELVEEAWKKVDEVVEDSFFKIRIRAFGWFALKKG